MSAGLRDPCPQVRWVSFTSFPSLFCLQAAPAICIFGRYEGVGKFGHFGNLQNLGHSQFKLSCTSLFFSIKILKKVLTDGHCCKIKYHQIWRYSVYIVYTVYSVYIVYTGFCLHSLDTINQSINHIFQDYFIAYCCQITVGRLSK